MIYIIESKGEHLSGNPDTVYKKKVMDKMTEVKQEGNLKAYQVELDFDALNESVEAYFVEENEEEEQIKSLMK